MGDKEWKEDFEKVNSVTLKDFDEGNYSIKHLVDLKKIANKYLEATDKLEEALLKVFVADKTKPYSYVQKNEAMNSMEELPTVGKRWLTPKELVTNYFGKEFWEEFNAWRSLK